MLHRAAVFAALLGLIGCRAESVTGTNAQVTGLSINAVSMLAGDSIVPTILVTVAGQTRPATPLEIQVTSSDTTVVVIAANDALVAVGHGQADITIAWAATPAISVTRTVVITSENLRAVRLLSSLSMVPGDSAAWEVIGTIRGGRAVPHPSSVTVTSRNPAVVAVTANLALANAPGQAWIVATAATGVADSALVTVALGAPARIAITPQNASLVAGQSLRLTVVSMSDRRGNAITTVTPTYSSTTPAIATAQSDGTVTAVAAGSALIVATAGAGADTLRLEVAAPPVTLQRLSVAPDSITLRPGDTARVAVRAFDSQGAQMAPPTLTWASLTGGIAVSSSGLITVSSGISSTIPNGVVRVSVGAVTTQLRVAVVMTPPSPPSLQQLTVTPDSVTLSPGGAAQIQVQAYDNRGAPMTLPVLTWQSTTPGITVSGAGLVTASLGIGATISDGAVQVSSGAIVASVRIAVIVIAAPPPPPDNGFVQIRWIGGIPAAAIVAAFEAQRVRINALFNSFAGVTPINPNVSAGFCLAGTPALNETVPGLIIYAQVAPIDGVGNVLGSAGPCLIRSGSLLPIVGTMTFDVADMDAMLANGSLNGVILHEMMHTLGFGSIWGPSLKNEVATPSGSDPRYLGATGQAAYAALGAADSASGVPVENTGGPGTAGGHWRESVFHTELMTGWADGAMPMSRVTIAALKDFGYDVDLNKADPFTLSASIVGAGLRASRMIVERTSAPIGVVGAGGQITPYAGTTGH